MHLNNNQAGRVVEQGAWECAGGKDSGCLAGSHEAHGPWRGLGCDSKRNMSSVQRRDGS